MKLKLFISVFLFSILLAQDRSTIFSTYTGEDPDPTAGGYSINSTDADDVEPNEMYGAANKFFVSNEYILERVYVYISHIIENPFQLQQIKVEVCEDNNGAPGEPLTSNIITLNPEDASGDWYSASLLSQCAKTNESSYHWITVLPLEETNATWIYSNDPSFVYSTTENNGEIWADEQNGYAGTSWLTAEQVYIPPFSGGDINGDLVVNILDVVAVVQYILGNTEFNEDQIAAADLTQDDVVNILDVIAMMNMIITPPEVVSDFLYEDINVNSESFGELVGPPIYEGMISCYYFGKAG